MFEVLVNGRRRLRREGDQWAEGTDVDLAGHVDRWPAAPYPLVQPGPIIEPDWANEVWVYLHAIEVLQEVLAIGRDQVEVVAAPDFGDLGDQPAGTVY